MTTTQSIASMPPTLGPQDLFAAEQDAFVLNRGDLYTLQVYIEAALKQPTTEEALRTILSRTKPTESATAEAVNAVPLPPNSAAFLQTLATIKRHCLTWKTETFPSIVALAGDIVDYNRGVPTYYGDLIALVPALRRNDPEAQADLRQLVEELSRKAKHHATRAADAARKAQAFCQETINDGTLLHGHIDDYTQQLGDKSDHQKALEESYKKQTQVYQEALAEYNHASIVAATTPSYAWVSIVAIGVAVVIAGVYGDRAVKAKQKMEIAVAQMTTLVQQMNANRQVVQTLGYAKDQVMQLAMALQAAIPVLERIQTSWESIHAHLNGIEQLLTTHISTVTPTKIHALVNTAIGEWKTVAKLADRYRITAFIDVQNPTPSAA